MGSIKFNKIWPYIDTSTPEGRLFFHMNAAFDQFQRELIVENTKACLVNAKKHGRGEGRPISMTEDKILVQNLC